MHTTLQDLRYAFRQLRNNPGFVAVTILVLALGIGVSTATFTVLNAVLLRKPAFRQIDRLVRLDEPRGAEEHMWGVSLPDIRDWRRQNRSLEQIAYYDWGTSRWERDSGTQTLTVISSSDNLFVTLGVQPLLGRTFSHEEEQAKAKVVVLNYQLWKESFASNPKVLGQTMRLDAVPYQIIGIMPQGFAYPLDEPGAVWAPLAATPEQEQQRGSWLLAVFGRLQPGVSLEQAQSELSALQKNIAQNNPQYALPDRVLVRRYWDTMRRREIAIRRALGAGKRRLVRQLLTESMVYSVTAAALGLGLAFIAIRSLELRLLREMSIHGHVNLRMDSTVFLAAVALSIISTVTFGLLPALQASGTPAQQGLQVKAGQSTIGHGRLRDGLVIGEIAISMLLLVASGLLLRTLYALHHVPLGFSTENILTSGFSIPPDRYAKESVNLALYQPIVERIEQIPGVQSAAVTSVMPLKRGFKMVGMFGIAGNKRLKPDELPQADMRFSSPGYPQTLGIVVERGRFFDPRIDTPTSQPVVVVNHTFAARYLPGEDATKKALSMGEKPPWSAVPIVGVIADVRQTSVKLPPGAEIHLPTSQLAPLGNPFYNVGSRFAQIAVRTRQKPESLIPAIRKVAHDIAPDVATGEFNTMTQVVEDNLGSQTLAARLVSLFAGATLLITITGLYGLLSYSVGQRTQEIGIRMALGAQRTHVVLMVLRHAFILLTFGLASGVLLALLGTRVLRSFLYGVHERDAATVLAVCLALCVCGTVAAWLPSRRAASVDPLLALRTE